MLLVTCTHAVNPSKLECSSYLIRQKIVSNSYFALRGGGPSLLLHSKYNIKREGDTTILEGDTTILEGDTTECVLSTMIHSPIIHLTYSMVDFSVRLKSPIVFKNVFCSCHYQYEYQWQESHFFSYSSNCRNKVQESYE